jgi:hypothetical protein
MLLVFLALYVTLGIGCLVSGIRRHARTAVTLGFVTLTLAVAFLVVWTLYVFGATHWTISLLQALLSPMPESLVEPEALSGLPIGLPTLAVAAIELVIAVGLWAIPVIGLVVAGRSPSRRTS